VTSRIVPSKISFRALTSPDLIEIVVLTLRVTGTGAADQHADRRATGRCDRPGALSRQAAYHGDRLHRHGIAAGRRWAVCVSPAVAERAIRLIELAVHAERDDRRTDVDSRFHWSSG